MQFLLSALTHLKFSFCKHLLFLHSAPAALKGWAADVVAQKVESKVAVESYPSQEQDFLCFSSEPKSEFKYMRNLAFLIYGGLYQGIFQEYLYNEEFNHLFGTGSDIQTALLKNGFNLLVIAPFLCLPMAYIIQALVMNKTVKSGIESYMDDVQQNHLVVSRYMHYCALENCMNS